jgi:TonB-dependent SusC/RagA subfamily outer membrane receptor
MKKILLIVAGVFIYTGLNAQLKTVAGKVTTFNEIPIQKAVIEVKSNKNKSYSDSLGNFSVQCSSKDQLTISAEGFSNRKIKIHEGTKFALVNLNLISKADAVDVAVGYGHVKDKDKLYSMASQNEGSLNFSRYSSIYEILTSNFTGVVVNAGAVIIRSSSSFGGSASALLIVDGREVDKNSFGNIVPSDIAQINVLKDASAAVYGSRGANGVVIVETKRGGKE